MTSNTEKYQSTILCVDDEIDILTILRAKINKIAEKVLICTNPAEAILIAQKENVDLMVMDLKMPEMDGITLFQEIKKVMPNMEGVFLTGFGDKKTVQEALRLGALDFIDKPFNDRALIATLTRALERIQYEKIMREILELFICENTTVDFSEFDQLSFAEREKTLKAALGLARMRIANMGIKRQAERDKKTG